MLLFSCQNKENKEKSSESKIIFIQNNNKNQLSYKLKNALAQNEFLPEKAIPDAETAINIAENVLFKNYGKDNIIKQRPYKIALHENYWIINGTLPEYSIGGTFLIIINSKDGQIIKLTHGE